MGMLNGKSYRSKRAHWIYLVPLLSMLSACGSGEALVKESAQLRWDALIAGDFTTAYQHYTDAFKETVSLQRFRKQVTGVGLWNKAKVEKVSCDQSGQRCDAEIMVTVALKMRGLAKPMETSDVIRETWVKEGVFSDWRYIKN